MKIKQIFRRLTRVTDADQYSRLLPSPQRQRSKSFLRSSKETTSSVPQGHVPVYVGDEKKRFVVKAELLKHPVFVHLLDRSAQEYGYEQQGVLQIPCHVVVFERILESLRLGLPVSIDLLGD